MRTRPQSTRDHPGTITVLAQMTPGQHAVVTGTAAHANPAVVRRLRQLGFRAQARVEVIRRAPMGDPTVYRVQDTELCLRRREAELIEVSESTEATG